MIQLFPEEKTQQSQYAPGPVDSDENILRLIFYPDHIDNGQLKPEAISRTDLRARGFSVQRRKFLRKSNYIQLRDNFLARDGRKLEGVSDVLCSEIRSVRNPAEDRIFKVVDAADNESETAHALIFFASAFKDSEQKKYRKLLIEIMCEIKSENELIRELPE